MRSPVLIDHFARLDSQRELLHRAAPGFSPAMVWERPAPERWSVGETLQHLVRMMRLFRRLSVVALRLQRPIAKARSRKPFPTRSEDIFSGRSLAAPFLVRPKPSGSPTLKAALDGLEKETESLRRALAGEEEAVLGHIWLWDPVMGASNLLQVVDLLAIHEEHHFRIMRERWPEHFAHHAP